MEREREKERCEREMREKERWEREMWEKKGERERERKRELSLMLYYIVCYMNVCSRKYSKMSI